MAQLSLTVVSTRVILSGLTHRLIARLLLRPDKLRSRVR
jgi:hypothetical protein